MNEEIDTKKRFKKDFLSARMYYFDADAFSKQALTGYIKKRAYYIWKEEGMPQGRDLEIWRRAEAEYKKMRQGKGDIQTDEGHKDMKPFSNKNEKENLYNRIANLEEAYRNLSESLAHIQEIKQPPQEIHPAQETEKKGGTDAVAENSRLTEHTEALEQERIILLEQLTSLESRNVALSGIEDENKNLKEQLNWLSSEKQVLLKKISDLTEERKDREEEVARLQRTKNALYLEKEREALEREISGLSHEKENLSNTITEMIDERKQLAQKISRLEKQEKAMVYLDKKNEMLEVEAKNLAEERTKLSGRITALEDERKVLLRRISDMEGQKMRLTHHRQGKRLTPEEEQKKQYAADRIKELEAERVQLFKAIRDLEEDKKVVPYLDKKNSILEDELRQSENRNRQLSKEIEKIQGENREMLEKINLLAQRRNTRLTLEQENGLLRKRIKDLEHKHGQLQDMIKELRHKKEACVSEASKTEYLKNAIARLSLEKGNLMQRADNIDEERMQLVKKITDLESKVTDTAKEKETLEKEREMLRQKISGLERGSAVNYSLDREKLTELKEFTLEAIQSRRWKSREFINGAYDAIGLFYRTILSDRPIKKNVK